MPKAKLVLWDWNGTLLDDLHLSCELLNHILSSHSYSQQFDLNSYRKIFGFPIEEYYRRAGFDFEQHPFSELAEQYMRLYNEQSHICKLSPHAVETLSALQKSGVSQVILSASPLPLLLRQTEFYQVQGFFSDMLGLSDNYARSKVELGKNWMKTAGFSPNETIMIGDTTHDAEVAAALGANCVLYSGGHQPLEPLQATGCPVISDLRQLVPLVVSDT